MALQKLSSASPRRTDQTAWLNNLTLHFAQTFEKTGKLHDLEQAIGWAQKAADATPQHHHRRATRLGILAALLGRRYEQTSATSDLDRAILLSRECVQATPFNHPNRAGRLHNLGTLLGRRFEQTETAEDLEEAIRCLQKAIAITYQYHSSRPGYHNSLGNLWAWKFRRTRRLVDVCFAIFNLEQAASSSVADLSCRGKWLGNLGMVAAWKYEQTGAEEDLHYAIRRTSEALQLTTTDGPARALSLICLGGLLSYRYSQKHIPADLEDSLSLYEEGWNTPEAATVTRLDAASKAAGILFKLQRWEESSDLLDQAVHLLSTVSSRDLAPQDKRHILSDFSELPTLAASAALQAGKRPVHAVQILEAGRDAISALRVNNRTTSGESALPLAGADLKEAASSGPVVILNASHIRCDAILVEAERIQLLPLPDLHYREIVHVVDQFTLLKTSRSVAQPSSDGNVVFKILEWLWNAMVLPILSCLGFHGTPCDTWPRLWWIPTGPLGQLPIHAAGLHSSSSDSVMDRVISSYSPSIKALLSVRRRSQSPKTILGKALLVAMETTPECWDLGRASDEMSAVSSFIESITSGPATKLQQPCKSQVIANLEACDVFHFIGHSTSHPIDHSNSSLLLGDWQTNLLTARNISKLDLENNPPFLAYLSACSTGAGMMTAFQQAGFRHTVGSLWDVLDEHSLVSSVEFYKNLNLVAESKGFVTDNDVARSVHVAASHVREIIEDPFGWAAFVHMGP